MLVKMVRTKDEQKIKDTFLRTFEKLNGQYFDNFAHKVLEFPLESTILNRLLPNNV